MMRRRDPITEKLNLTPKQLEEIKSVTFGQKVKTDREANRAFSKVLLTLRQIGERVLEDILTSWIQAAFPHLLPLWFSFIRFLHNPRDGFQWPY